MLTWKGKSQRTPSPRQRQLTKEMLNAGEIVLLGKEVLIGYLIPSAWPEIIYIQVALYRLGRLYLCFL